MEAESLLGGAGSAANIDQVDSLSAHNFELRCFYIQQADCFSLHFSDVFSG